MYLSSQIFRYQVTQNATVKASAWKHFEALELLNKVTGRVHRPQNDPLIILIHRYLWLPWSFIRKT